MRREMSWREFGKQSLDLASFGALLLSRMNAYLATTQGDSSPRIHPVMQIIDDGYEFIFIYPRPPKPSDLLRDGRYAIHSVVIETSGLSSDFMIPSVA